jgi:hypothetical protein
LAENQQSQKATEPTKDIVIPMIVNIICIIYEFRKKREKNSLLI